MLNLNSHKKQYKVVEAELRRTLPEAQITILKNINIKPRVNAFQIRFRRLLIFSKLLYGKLCKAQDIANIVMAITRRNRYEIQRIIVHLATQDLCTFLKNKTGTVKISYKFIVEQIDKILETNFQKLTVNLMNNKTQVPNTQKNSRPQTSRITASRGKNKKSIVRPQQEFGMEHKSKTSKQLGKENDEQGHLNHRNSKLKNRRVTSSRYSILDPRTGLKNGIKFLCNKKQEGSDKYMYLSKEMDVECGGEQEEDFQILELSEEEKNEQNLTTIDEDQLMQRKMQQGLNFKLTANYSQRKYSRKYSSEYQKFAELLEQELKQDELKLQRQSSKFQQEAAAIKNKSNQSSESQSNQQLSVFDIDQKELVSKRDLWNDEIENSRKCEIDLLEEVHINKNDKEFERSQLFKRDNNAENQIQNKKQQQDISLKNVKTEKQQDLQQVGNQNKLQTQEKIQMVIKNYQSDFHLKKIKGKVAQIQERQIYLNIQQISSLSQLSHIILYLHRLNPSHFLQVLHSTDLSQVNLSTQITLNKITLFNPLIGMFQTYNLKIGLSMPYGGEIPSWVLVVCQAALQALQRCGKGIYQILRILTGAPIVKLHGVDLRRIKRVIVENIFQNKNERKGKILCSKQIEPNSQLEFCQLVQFQKDKDFLQSKVTYVKFLSVCNQTYQTSTKSYEEFVLSYQNIMLCFFKVNYYHNQQISQFCAQNRCRDSHDAEDYWRIQIQLQNHTEVFLEFNEHEKLDKQNHILILKVVLENNQEETQPIGQLNKKGNFFFELSLEPGIYFIQITRQFDAEQLNSVHFYSSSPTAIKSSQIISK